MKVLEYLGKPMFWAFTVLVMVWFILLQLVLSIRLPTFKLPQWPKLPKLPKIRALPTIKLPEFSLSLRPVAYLTIFVSFIVVIYVFVLHDLPSARLLTDSPPSLTTRIFDRHNNLLYQIYKDENRTLISLSDLPQHVLDSTLAAEDKNFYHHHGVDLGGIFRAALNNLKCSLKNTTCSLQGGSTITQQLVKNTLLSPQRTLERKVKELVLALQVESLYTKEEILEMYLNQIGYGGTAYGIEQASREYFGISAKDLSLPQSAMLAGLPIAPTSLSPFGTTPYLGKIRQQQVLESMVSLKMISENDKLDALNTSLVFRPQITSIYAPHFVMYIKDILVKQYGESMVARGGLSVTTSLDLSSQAVLQEEIKLELSRLKNLNVQNGAGLVLDPQAGEILAMVGSQDFFAINQDGQVNVTLQKRQPGSAIKPITYALALSSGMTLNSVLDDSPICFIIPGQPNYCPKNYDNRFHGPVTLRTALASSYNVPAVKLLNSLGLVNMIHLARNLGITTWDDPSRFGLSLTLGGGEITMLDLASVYATFARGGTKIPLTPILKIEDSNGISLALPTPAEAKEVVSPGVAFLINSALSDPFARAPAFGTNSILSLPGPNVAVKTGTTNDLRDNWTFGYTNNLLVATWVGNNDNSPMSSVASGVTGASPIWARTISKLLKEQGSSPFIPPTSITRVNTSCSPAPRYEYFVKGTEPKINCLADQGDIGVPGTSTSQ